MPTKPAVFGRKSPVGRHGGSATLRDHSRAYRALCARLLDREPLCRYCRGDGLVVPATITDHIVALSLGGTNDPENLAPACRGCNDAKAADERAFLAKGYDVADMMQDAAMAGWIGRGLPQTVR